MHSNTTIVSINPKSCGCLNKNRHNSNTTIVSINHMPIDKQNQKLEFKYNYCFY